LVTETLRVHSFELKPTASPFIFEANEYGIVLNYFTQQGNYRGSFVSQRNTVAEVRSAQYAIKPTGSRADRIKSPELHITLRVGCAISPLWIPGFVEITTDTALWVSRCC
jgi:hypothetical protein